MIKRVLPLAILAAFCLLLLGAGNRAALPPLHDAAAHGRLDEVQQLIANDPSLALSRDEGGNTALHHAAANGWVPIADLLLKAGTPVDIPKEHHGDSYDGWAPLHHAADRGQVEMIRLLLRAGAHVDSRAEDGAMPLHLAAWNGHTDAVKLLLDAHADPNARRNTKVTPLESAAFFGHAGVVAALLAAGADPNGRVYDGNTPLHQAVRNGQLEIVRQLVEAKASLEARREDGQTPLHTAAASGQVPACAFLISLGADVMAKDKNDDTPLALAQRSGRSDTAGFLRSYLADRNEIESQIAARKALNSSLPSGPLVDKTVYGNDFSGGTIGDEWSWTPRGAYFSELRLTPIGNTGRRYLGSFGSQNVRLTLYQLPAHQQVTVSLDLLILDTWDGPGIPGTGPDLWEASVTGGPLLLRATFANREDDWKIPAQSFPDDFTQGVHPSRAGAVARNVPGLGADPSKPRNAVYRLKFTFAHTAPYVVLNFSGLGLQELTDESWGISRIEVHTAASTPAASPRRRP